MSSEIRRILISVLEGMIVHGLGLMWRICVCKLDGMVTLNSSHDLRGHYYTEEHLLPL